jgi:phosphocarrier protein HPr
MPEVNLTLQNKTGLHARPAGAFVRVAKQFQSDIKVLFNGKEANAKSILSVLSLGAENGAAVWVVAQGPDAEDALKAVKELVTNKFGEPE